MTRTADRETIAPVTGDRGVGETPKQRRDRELMELLNELRLATPGVQVLFGFLLIVPFNRRWDETSGLERDLYLTTLTLTAFATILLIGASVQHRLLFRRHFEARMLPIANRLALAGLTCLGAALVTGVLFVAHFVFDGAVAAGIGAATGVLIIALWYVLPLVRLRHEPGEDDPAPPSPPPEP